MGLIERKPDANDKRMVRIFLTPFGVESREISKQTVISFNETVKAGLSNEEQEVFFSVMRKINKLLEDSDQFQSNQILSKTTE